MATALDRVTKLREQMDAAMNDALAELRESRKEAQAKVDDIDRQMKELTGEAPTKTRKPRAEGKGRVCSVCGVAGHNKRGHAAYVASQGQ